MGIQQEQRLYVNSGAYCGNRAGRGGRFSPPPARDSLALIKQYQQSLPEGCALNALGIDAAGYQAKIIEYCDEQGFDYAIRDETSPAMLAQTDAANESGWQPLTDKKGKAISDQENYRTSFYHRWL